MTKANPQISSQIEEMRARLNENAEHEQALLRALSEALGQVDQQLLNEVRQVTAEHEARRSDILGELHVLASRLCVFPKPISNDTPRVREQVTVIHGSTKNGSATHAPGDWRQAASNIDEELDLYFDARTQTNSH